MPKKGTKLYSILHNKCPRCHEGDFFVNSSPYKFKNNLKIYDNCSSCGLKYMLEPSFFYGAMYISYALTVALAVAIFVICYLLGFGLITSFVSIIVILILLMPFTMRLSRILYINLFVHFDSNSDIKKKK
jgi:uncharacterized protein (DUF983 family)